MYFIWMIIISSSPSPPPPSSSPSPSSRYKNNILQCLFEYNTETLVQSIWNRCHAFKWLLMSIIKTPMTYISDMTWPISARFGHKYRLTIPFMSHDQIGVKCHVGVTMVKKVIFTKNTTPPTDNIAWSYDLRCDRAWEPPQKFCY